MKFSRFDLISKAFSKDFGFKENDNIKQVIEGNFMLRTIHIHIWLLAYIFVIELITNNIVVVEG